MIARDVNSARAFARFAQNFLNDVIMLLRPINSAPQLPDIDQIADNIKRLELVLAQEIEQRAGITAARAQVHVGYPRCAHTADSTGFQLRLFEGKSGCG